MTHTLVTDPHSLTDDTPAGIENVNDAPVSDSVSDVPRETDAPDTDADTGRDVSRETVADDVPRETVGIESHVTDAVESAVSQWVGFDPEIHAVNADGTPRLRVNGAYALKRGNGGAKRRAAIAEAASADTFHAPEMSAGVSEPAPTPKSTRAPPSLTQASAATITNAQTAVFLVNTVTGILSRTIGPEWAADKTETKGLSDATKQYLDSVGGLEISPGMALCLAVASYAAPRFAHENTRSRLGRVYDWCRDRYHAIRGRMGV